MIVKCEQCETRFKIPDEKVTDKGVKVRCTKCQHTFRVVREEAVASGPAPVAASVAPAPVAKPAMAPRAAAPPVGKPAAPPAAPARPAPPVAPLPGLASPRGGAVALPRVTSLEAPRTPATLDLDPLMEFAGEARPLTPALSLSFDEKDPFAAVETPAAPRPAVARPLPVSARPAAVPKPAPGLAPPVPSVPAPARAPAPMAPKPAMGLAPAVAAPSRSPAPLPPRAAVPAPVESPPAASWDLPPADDGDMMEGLEGNNPFVSFEPPPPVAPPPRAAPRTAPPVAAPVPSENLPDWDAPEQPQADSANIPDWGAPEQPQADSANIPDWGAPEQPQADSANIPDWGAPEQPQADSVNIPDWGAPEQPQADSANIPDWGAPEQPQAAAPSAIPDWGAPASQPQAAVPSAIPDWGAPAAQAGAPSAPMPFTDFRSEDPGPPEREVLSEVPEMPEPEPTPVPAAPVAAPVAAPSRTRSGPMLVQRLVSVAVQLVVVALLMIGLLTVILAALNDGRVEFSALSMASVREWISPTLPLVARDMSNGLYDTQGGKPLFYVRGEAVNRGTAPTRVKALVSLFDGPRRVLSAEAIAGKSPTSEEVYSIQNAAQATALRMRLDAAAEPVAPGASLPFVVLFVDYPENLADLRLEVKLEAQDVAATGDGAREGNAGNAQP